MSELAVICPTKGRPDKLAALVANVHEVTTTSHIVYLVMEHDDEDSRRAAEQLDVWIVVGGFGSCAAAVNAGYRASVEPLFAVINDDCLLHAGWDVNALAKLDADHHIIGLNDGSGDTKCFQLVRRAYIEEHSGVYDKPNTVYHTYRSQCPDTEFAHYAMLRGVWQDAHDAVCEHVHWRMGKADPSHPNYVKARETNAADLEEYTRRRREWDPANVTPACVPGAVMA